MSRHHGFRQDLCYAVALASALGACSTPVTPGYDGSGLPDATCCDTWYGDMVVVDAQDASAPDARDVVVAVDAQAGCTIAGCATGLVCCASTGACYNPACLSCCMVPVDSGVRDAGATCASNASCAATSYCEGTGCGTTGTCTPRPSTCTGLYAPVCGCDGITYPNACSASAAGQRVATTGACPSGDGGTTVCHSSAECGAGMSCCTSTGACYPSACLGCCMPRPGDCVDNAGCAVSEFCDGAGCGTAGTCTRRPDVCDLVYDPVCGCDGATYSNACTANVAGERIASTGVCGTTTDDAGLSPCATVRCSSGYTCCPSTGVCYPSACLSCCM